MNNHEKTLNEDTRIEVEALIEDKGMAFPGGSGLPGVLGCWCPRGPAPGALGKNRDKNGIYI